MKIEIESKYVNAVKAFAATKDIRAYLNAICLEIGKKEWRMIATNGHNLGVAMGKTDQPQLEEPVRDIIIPLTLLPPMKALKVFFEIGDLQDEYVRPVTITCGNVSCSGVSMDYSYPNWRDVFPREVSGEMGVFSPTYVGETATVNKLLGLTDPPVLIHNGEGVARVVYNDKRFSSIIMPLQCCTLDLDTPEWVHACI